MDPVVEVRRLALASEASCRVHAWLLGQLSGKGCCRDGGRVSPKPWVPSLENLTSAHPLSPTNQLSTLDPHSVCCCRETHAVCPFVSVPPGHHDLKVAPCSVCVRASLVFTAEQYRSVRGLLWPQARFRSLALFFFVGSRV